MIIYEICECEEYAFQGSRGLYSNKAKAIEKAQKLCKESFLINDRGEVNASVIEIPGGAYILAGLWDLASFTAWRDKQDTAYWWYRPPFSHDGVFGVFEREVIE